MKKRPLMIQQMDAKLKQLAPLKQVATPSKGWVMAIRAALGMSQAQLGEKLSITRQSAQQIESREMDGSITLRSLREIANALDMQLVYGFVPKDESLDALIERKATELATKIVMRTSQSMKLEGQKNSDKRIRQAIQQKANEIKDQLPKMLWD